MSHEIHKIKNIFFSLKRYANYFNETNLEGSKYYNILRVLINLTKVL